MNQGENARNQRGNAGNRGGNEGNQGDNLRIGVEMMDKNMESDKNKKKCAHL